MFIIAHDDGAEDRSRCSSSSRMSARPPGGGVRTAGPTGRPPPQRRPPPAAISGRAVGVVSRGEPVSAHGSSRTSRRAPGMGQPPTESIRDQAEEDRPDPNPALARSKGTLLGGRAPVKIMDLAHERRCSAFMGRGVTPARGSSCLTWRSGGIPDGAAGTVGAGTYGEPSPSGLVSRTSAAGVW